MPSRKNVDAPRGPQRYDRNRPSGKSNFCPVHKTSSPRLRFACPSCRQPVHFHFTDAEAVKRGVRVEQKCGHCRLRVSLYRNGQSNTFSIVRFDGENPIFELKLF